MTVLLVSEKNEFYFYFIFFTQFERKSVLSESLRIILVL